MAFLLFDFEGLASPLTEASPSGADLTYDPKFVELERVATGRPERQFGDKIYPAEPPDWPSVLERALELAGLTRDLRVAVLLARSGARVHGLGGYASGLALVHALLERQWDSVHPQLDASDGNDPTMRMSALATLSSLDGGLADLRAARLGPGRTLLTVREIELGMGAALPHGEEAPPSVASLIERMRELFAADPALAGAIALASTSAEGIARVVDERASEQAPDVKPLLTMLGALAAASAQAAGQADDGADAGLRPALDARTTASTRAARLPAGDGSIGSRSDAEQALDRVCAWIEQNEPTSPAPLLIRRARRLMGMNFIEVMRDLAPESLGQIGVIAGVTDVDPGA